MLCACGPVASVIGLAEVQRGYEVIVNTPVAPHSSGFAAISYTHPHCSPQVVRYNIVQIKTEHLSACVCVSFFSGVNTH